MTNYRRIKVPGGTYFFTVALARRGSDTLVRQVDALRVAWAQTCLERPFQTDAVVILPDHLHAIWTLPSGDADYSTRWRLIKSRFSRAVGAPYTSNPCGNRKGEREMWQRRFWEHYIRDQAELDHYRQMCWTNPVSHGVVRDSKDWPHSSIHRDAQAGLVPEKLTVPNVTKGAGEPFWSDPVRDSPALTKMGEITHPTYQPAILG